VVRAGGILRGDFSSSRWFAADGWPSPLQNERAAEAAERFVPSLVGRDDRHDPFLSQPDAAGCGCCRAVGDFLQLGIFASRTLLRAGITYVGANYLLAGMVDFDEGARPHAFSPWAMGVDFGVGQLLAAAVLYWNWSDDHGRKQA
jgi:hypothetical protein